MASLGMCSRFFRSVYGLNKSVLCISPIKRYPWRPVSASSNANPSETSDSSSSSKADESPDPEIKTEGPSVEDVLKGEKEKLELQITSLEDKYKRSLAETENVRQRLGKQISDAKLFGIQGFCKDLLEVGDILGKATESVPKEDLNKDNPQLINLYQGLTMTETQLHKVFNRHGLFKLDPKAGEKFDPNIHEALFEQPMPDKEPGTIAVVTKIGYSLHNRTIRPALVGVVKAP